MNVRLSCLLLSILTLPVASFANTYNCGHCGDPVGDFRSYGNYFYDQTFGQNAFTRSTYLMSAQQGIVRNPKTGQFATVRIQRDMVPFSFLGISVRYPGPTMTITVQSPDVQSNSYSILVGTGVTTPRPAVENTTPTNSQGAASTTSGSSSPGAAAPVAFNHPQVAYQRFSAVTGTPIVTLFECAASCDAERARQ
ncbi:MAG: hypothetical protein AAF648_07350 [Pseudomonadota bacterium]